MPLLAEELTYKESVPHSSGATLIYEHPHRLLQQLERASGANDLAGTRAILSQLGPLPIHVPTQVPPKARVCLSKAVLFAAANPSEDFALLKALLEAGLAPYDYSCLGVDDAFKQKDTRALAVFLAGGWDINEGGPGKRMRPLLRHAVDERSTELRAWLLAHGADPNVENERRLTPLETAAQGWAPVAVLREFLASGGDPARVGDESLLLAAERGDLERAAILLEAGADVNAREKEDTAASIAALRRGRTVLGAAVEYGREEMVKWLLQKGASVERRDGRGETAVDVAKRMKMDDLVAILSK